MRAWEDLLGPLTSGPRENGSRALERTADWLVARLRDAGWDVQTFPFTAHPHEMQMLGLAVLLLGAAYFLLIRARRFEAALAVAIIAPVLTVAVVDYRVPALGGFGETTQRNVIATLPAAEPARRLILSAHFDTKTELLDHVARTPVQALAVPVFGLLIAAPLRGIFRRMRGKWNGRLERAAGPVALGYGAAIALTYAAGAVLPWRSPGALDDGAACAVLVRAAGELADGPPPEHTEVQIVLFSGEELGAHGAWAWASDRFPPGSDLPTTVVNFELVGSSKRFLVGGETSLTRHYRPPPDLLDLLDEASVAAGGKPLHRSRGAGLTDAVAFLAAGVPAATVVGREGRFLIPRGMHSARDDPRRIDPEALELTRRLVHEIVRAVDRGRLEETP